MTKMPSILFNLTKNLDEMTKVTFTNNLSVKLERFLI